MQYAKVAGTVVLKYPYTVFDLTVENNTNYGLVDDPDLPGIFEYTAAARAEGSSLEPVQPTAAPVVDADTQLVVEVTPEVTGGAWAQKWSVQDKPLADCITARQASLFARYSADSQQPVTYTTAAGVTKVFQADLMSQQLLQTALAGLSGAQTVPAGFFWVAADNTHATFAFSDLQGLAAAMLLQGWQAFQRLQARKASLRAATTPEQVRAVTW